MFIQLEPKPIAASSSLGEILSSPESIEPFEMVRNLLDNSKLVCIAIKLNFELEIVINEIANTVPGIA